MSAESAPTLIDNPAGLVCPLIPGTLPASEVASDATALVGFHLKLILGSIVIFAAGALIGYVVADTIDIEDIRKDDMYCRCWKSKNWPYCAASHMKHNILTGDNIGPLIMKKSK